MYETESPREREIEDLLRIYRDLEGVSQSGDRALVAVNGGGDRMLYREGGDWDKSGCDLLDELLKRMKIERPSQHWHVKHRYLDCEVRRRTVKLERRKGQMRLPKPGPHAVYLTDAVRPADAGKLSEAFVVVETWNPAVRREKVRAGVKYLSDLFHREVRRSNHLTHATAA